MLQTEYCKDGISSLSSKGLTWNYELYSLLGCTLPESPPKLSKPSQPTARSEEPSGGREAEEDEDELFGGSEETFGGLGTGKPAALAKYQPQRDHK